uniref:Uncharacterized protein n=1 Tax=Arundo donax TaxID=35708 RepID=A0A0A9BUS4_ARUDO
MSCPEHRCLFFASPVRSPQRLGRL